ncbi:MAG: thiamine phosphate synthase [Acidobacteriota bacterium]
MSQLKPKTLLCLITNRRTLNRYVDDTNFVPLLDLCQRAADTGIDLIQIREKDLPTDQLSKLVEAVVSITEGSDTSVLVNDRVDIALTCGAKGVHLRSDSLPVEAVRQLTGENFIIGASSHSVTEAIMAAEAGASFVLFGPVFATPSKEIYGAPLGLQQLTQAVQLAKCPVLALGGINLENSSEVLATGAAGLAAIRLFAEAERLEELVYALKGQ